MADSYYYWFDNTEKGIKPPKVRPITKKDVVDVIEEYVVHVKDDEELDKVPKLIKNIEKYTTTWGGKWDESKKDTFEEWVKDSYELLMKKELRQLADEHLQNWGDFYEGLHLSQDKTTIEDLLSGSPKVNIREFAGYQFAPPESDLGEAQRNLSMQRKNMKWKEFLNEKAISNLDVINDKSGNTVIKFTIEHSDGRVQKEIFRQAFPNAQINTKKNPASHGKSIADYSNVIQSESGGGKSLPQESDKDKATERRNNKIRKGLESIFTINTQEDKDIWEDIFISDVKQIEVKKPSKITFDKDKIYEYELKTDNELRELFKPTKGKKWELEDERGKQIEYPEQVDFEESQEDFQQRVLGELSEIKKLPKKIKVKRVKGLDDKADYVTLDGKKFTRSEMEYYKPIKSENSIEEDKEYKPKEYSKNKFKTYVSNAVTKLLPKDVEQEEPAYIEISQKDIGIYISDETVDKVFPMAESWARNNFNPEFVQPIIGEIINGLPEVLTSRERKMKDLSEKFANTQGSELTDAQLIHLEKYLLNADEQLENFKESEMKKHSVSVSGDMAKKLIGSLTQDLGTRREILTKLVQSKPFYEYLKKIGLNMNPWYLSDYKFELLFNPTVILENMAKHKVLTFVPVIEEIPKLMISRKALIATQGKKSSYVVPEISKPAKGGQPATAAVEYTKTMPPADLKANWEKRQEEARGLNKDERKKVLEQIGKEKRDWKTQNIKGFNEAKEFWGERIFARTNRLKKLIKYLKEGTE
mgnify:CR=1 FL=1